MVRWTREIKLSIWATAKGHSNFLLLRGYSFQAPSPLSVPFKFYLAPQFRQLQNLAPGHFMLWRKCILLPSHFHRGKRTLTTLERHHHLLSLSSCSHSFLLTRGGQLTHQTVQIRRASDWSKVSHYIWWPSLSHFLQSNVAEASS